MAIAAVPTPSLPERRDPLARVLELGRRELPIGALIGILGALALHGAAAAKAGLSLYHLALFAERVQSVVVERQRASIDIDKIEAPPLPKIEDEKPVEKQPEEKLPVPPKAAAKDQPTEAAPPEAAQAGKLLTQEPSADDPLDLTDQGFVTGEGDRYAGGTTAASGTSTTAVRDPRARAGGKPGSTGEKPGAPASTAPAGKDQSRPSAPASRNWNCGFPPEADFDQIDFATVMISVTVGTDGRAKSVSVLSDPGHGFGRLARSCAMRMQYNPGYDRNGQPVVKTTSPFPVRFTR